jgi:hypothetical protein
LGRSDDVSNDFEPGMNRTTVKRWSKISLRTLHLLAVAGVGGGILFALEKDLWVNYWWLALVSGVLMMVMDIAANPVWMVQVRGVVIIVKLILLALMVSYPAWGSLLLLVIIIISAVISHAPGKLRYYSLYHRRVISSDSDAKG